jgi:hypothetical protein
LIEYVVNQNNTFTALEYKLATCGVNKLHTFCAIFYPNIALQGEAVEWCRSWSIAGILYVCEWFVTH